MSLSTLPNACYLCPRECGVDRAHNQKGICGEGAGLRIAYMGLHLGEEPSFTGTSGSGTVFFSGCPCGCVFCQNHQISREGVGTLYSVEKFQQALIQLAGSGVHNINFVTPEHVWPFIQNGVEMLKAERINIPVIWNSSGYCRGSLIRDYSKIVSIFLPDYKFADGALAKTCMQDERYPQIVERALETMVAEKGFLYPWDPTGEEPAVEGVLVRHLVLPGQLENTRLVLERLHALFGKKLPISIMSQYRPVPGLRGKGAWGRRLRSDEYAQVCKWIEEYGFEHVYIQEPSQSDDFFPDFNESQPFKGSRRD